MRHQYAEMDKIKDYSHKIIDQFLLIIDWNLHSWNELTINTFRKKFSKGCFSLMRYL